MSTTRRKEIGRYNLTMLIVMGLIFAFLIFESLRTCSFWAVAFALDELAIPWFLAANALFWFRFRRKHWWSTIDLLRNEQRQKDWGGVDIEGRLTYKDLVEEQQDLKQDTEVYKGHYGYTEIFITLSLIAIFVIKVFLYFHNRW